MKRMLLSLLCLISLFTIAAPSVAAVNLNSQVCSASGNAPDVCKDSNPGSNPLVGPGGIVTIAAQIFSIITGIAAVIIIIISGFKYMTSQGDSRSVESAKQTLIYALVGLVVAASAQGIVSLVLTKL